MILRRGALSLLGDLLHVFFMSGDFDFDKLLDLFLQTWLFFFACNNCLQSPFSINLSPWNPFLIWSPYQCSVSVAWFLWSGTSLSALLECWCLVSECAFTWGDIVLLCVQKLKLCYLLEMSLEVKFKPTGCWRGKIDKRSNQLTILIENWLFCKVLSMLEKIKFLDPIAFKHQSCHY